MQQYKVISDIIKGARPGETVNLTEDEARAYWSDYVELIWDVPTPENSDEEETAEESQEVDQDEKNEENSDEEIEQKEMDKPTANKAITKAKNKWL